MVRALLGLISLLGNKLIIQRTMKTEYRSFLQDVWDSRAFRQIRDDTKVCERKISVPEADDEGHPCEDAVH